MQFSLLDLNLLRVFDALIEERSVTRAASRLHITPSAVSHSLGRLRVLFEDQLFVRGPQGMAATPRAAEIGPRLREGLHRLEIALVPVGFVPRESGRTFTIACSGYVCAILLPQLMTRIQSEAPGTKLIVRSLEPGIVDDVEAGRVDIMVGRFGNIPERFESEALFQDDPVWLLGRDYLQPKAPLSAERLAKLPKLVSPSGVSAEMIDGVVVENGLERHLAMDEHSGVVGIPLGNRNGGPILATIPYSSVAPLIVKHSDLAALLPRRLATLFAQDFGLDLVEPSPLLPQMEFAALWHRDHGEHPAVDWFRGLVAETAAVL